MPSRRKRLRNDGADRIVLVSTVRRIAGTACAALLVGFGSAMALASNAHASRVLLACVVLVAGTVGSLVYGWRPKVVLSDGSVRVVQPVGAVVLSCDEVAETTGSLSKVVITTRDGRRVDAKVGGRSIVDQLRARPGSSDRAAETIRQYVSKHASGS